VRLIFFPLAIFFYCVFGRFSIRGTQKRDKKNHVIVRVQNLNPGQIKYVRTLVVFFIFFSVAPWKSEKFFLFLNSFLIYIAFASFVLCVCVLLFKGRREKKKRKK
jgi:hypothetical protein